MSSNNLNAARSKIIISVIVLVVIALGGYILFGSSSSAKYRLASASLGNVSQSISVSGTIEPTSSQNLDFGSAGKVATVNVVVGQQVQSGAVLASLDTTALQAQVASAQASLSSAQLKLANDQAAASAASAATSSPQSSANISNLENAVSADQAKLSADQKAEQSACSQTSSSMSSYPASAKTGSSTRTGSALSAPSTSSSCTSAQLQFSSDQIQLSNAQQKYMNALSQEISNSKSSSQSSQSSISPQQITADQDAVTAAQDNLNIAENNLSNATITAPFSGTIAQVNISPGQQFGSGGSGGSSGSASATPAIVINGTGSYNVQASISDAQINQIKTGNSASITPAGFTTSLSGTVTQITPFATTTAGVTTYPVTVSINGSPSGLFPGASAQVSIVIAQKHQVLTVPTSAIHSIGSHQFVLIQKGKKIIHQKITTGISGNFSTQILSGLHSGEQIILSKITSTVPGTGLGKKGPFGGGGGGAKKKVLG